MHENEIFQYLNEYYELYPVIEDIKQFIVETAFFVEDVFNIILTDKEITPENLGSHDTLETFVRAKLQLEDTCAESAE